MNRNSQFESLAWSHNEDLHEETPAITPGVLAGARKRESIDDNEINYGITFGVYWNRDSFPAWTGRELTRDMRASEQTPFGTMSVSSPIADASPSALSPLSSKLNEKQNLLVHACPFTVTHIAQMIDQITDVFGFQPDVAVNVFELLMSQLDSRAARSNPRKALRSLHGEYISGVQANYRRWYFAAEIDLIDLKAETISRTDVDAKLQKFNDSDYYMETSLEDAEYVWDHHYSLNSDEDMLVDIIIYLMCWSEANQLRFMPECIAFIVNCCLDYYRSYFMPFPQQSRDIKDLPRFFFLEKVITPIYEVYCNYNFIKNAEGELRRKENDHKKTIGYDDINQIFWYKTGLERIKVKNPHFNCNDPETQMFNKNCDFIPLVYLPPNQRLLELQNVDWAPTFTKTYRESRTWLHSITNFSRIWIIHSTVFWFYTAYHVPSLYSPGSTYDNPIPPKEFVKWTIMSLGGVFGPLITLFGLIGELRFIPRKSPGAKPIFSRIALVTIMLLVLLVPGVCNLAFNSWTSDDQDLIPATVTAGVLFGIAIIYSVYLSFQPLQSVHGYNMHTSMYEESNIKKRKYLSSYLFTACFPERDFNDAVLSWLLCVLVFVAKFTESYFFLTLSVRDPVYELRIMDLNQTCIGDRAFFGQRFCNVYPKLLLAGIVFTDFVLFFLDTYLWYVILNTLISVSISFKSGTSIWTPWRNIYSRLATRISTKLLTRGSKGLSHNAENAQRLYALRIVWNSIIESMFYGHVISREQAVRLTHINESTHEPDFFTMEEDGNALNSSNEKSNAYRRISFFAQSLSTPMKTAVPVNEMPGFTVLIPHYKETMVLGLKESISVSLGAKVTILEYLQKLYPGEWDNFVQENQKRLNEESMDTFGRETTPQSSKYSITSSSESEVSYETTATTSRKLAVQKLGFSSLDPNDTVRTRLWCSERTQTLYRTLKGFSNYSNALRVLYFAEEESDFEEGIYKKGGVQRQDYDKATALCARKFKLLVAMQLYSSYTPEQLKEVEIMLHVVPELTISYIEHEKHTNRYYVCHIDGTCPMLENERRKPRLRIRLSGNPILGDGKADNQNSALPFYRGEYIQLVDANQDNYLEECLKIRNLLMEFEPSKTQESSIKHTQVDVEAGLSHDTPPSILAPGPSPIAIVGAREYIFSENIGVLGDVAAGKEQTFGTLFSRTLAKVGAKLHYGHPDFLNAIFMTTRGGVSKAQGGLHLNEDIYAGMTAVIRGGRIKHSEYFQCGKGRDLGFVSILNFTSKIGAGMGEQVLSREYFYMGTQLPFDRFMTFYYAHPGFHLNNAFIMLSLEMLLIVILWINSIGAVNTDCKVSSQMKGERPSNCVNVTPLINWVKRCVISIFLVFFVSLCPLFFQEFTERGLIRSIVRILKHFCSLSMLFEIFTCRIYARSFWEDMNIGGARYLATGRGFATARIEFFKLYASYNAELVSGVKSAMILLFASIVSWSVGYLWFWVTTASLCLCPFLYNPHQFAFTDFFVDYSVMLKWFWRSEVKEEELDSWTVFTREARTKLTGVKNQFNKAGRKPSLRNAIISKLGSAVVGFLFLVIPYIYLGGQKESRYQSEPGSYSVFVMLLLIATISSAASLCLSFASFLFASLLHLVGVKSHANFVAIATHTLMLLVLVATWWAVYIISMKSFTVWILGVACVCSLHHLWHTVLTVVMVRRQRSVKESNNPWWSGDWRSAKLGMQILPVILEEMGIKHMENLQYAYDFLMSHLLLGLQVPFLLLPCVDKVHTLFLMWLRPSVTEAASRASSIKRQRRLTLTARLMCMLFVVNCTALALLATAPLYAPQSVLDSAEAAIVRSVHRLA